MKNVYITRNEEGEFYILPSAIRTVKKNNIDGIGVVIYLFYFADIDFYYKYIKNIPDAIDILLISSDKDIIFNLKNRIQRGNSYIKYKVNRGRDVAALLIDAKDFVESHKYVAFLHDKKAKKQQYCDEIYRWTEALWDNTIGSECYIYNVVALFEESPKLGLALPTANVGKLDMCVSNYVRNGWRENYEKAKTLEKELGLKCDINKKFPPISFGTMFWFRTKALRKLFEKDWSYDDFQEEPMDSDGTISHAIERIFPYVAQDTGYRTCMIMNDSFVGEYLGSLDSLMYGLWSLVDDEFGIRYPYQILDVEAEKERFEGFFDSKEKIYIYGAGEMGKSCYKYLTRIIKKQPEGFVDKYKCGQSLFGLSIKSLEEVQNYSNVGIIVAVGDDYIDVVIKEIKDLQIIDYIVYLSLYKEDI